MREIAATAQGETPTPIERCFEQLADIEGYPSWYPSGVKRAEQLERGPGGELTKVQATLALNQGPIQRDFTLDFAVTLERPRLVELQRVPHLHSSSGTTMVIAWRLRELAAELTEVVVDFNAQLDIPRFLPLGGIADSIAGGFLGAALESFAAGG
jgi:hypothetical protein